MIYNVFHLIEPVAVDLIISRYYRQTKACLKMKNIITYSRVSTEEQKKQGFSLNAQKERLFNFVRSQNYNILMHYEEDYSAKTFKRPEWVKLRNYCERSYQIIDMIIFTKWDRLSRNAIEAQLEIEWFREKGIEIYSVDNPLDFNLPESKVALAIYLSLSEIENDKISIRVKEGLKKANEEGCWTSTPPYGYSCYRTSNNKPTLVPDENSNYVHDAFILLASHEISVRQAWFTMRSQGMMISSSQFYNLVRNITYTGKILLRSNYVKAERIEGLHAPIITTALFEKVQKRLDKRRQKPPKRKVNRDSLYPLRGYLKCSRCSKSLTASASTGRNPDKKYHYYHCDSRCGERMPVTKVHELFSQYLRKMSINKNQFLAIKERIKLKIRKKEQSLVERKKKLYQKIGKLKKVITRAEDKHFEGVIDSETFINAKKRYTDKIYRLQNKLLKIKHFNRAFEFQSRVEKIKKLIDLPRQFDEANPVEKRELLDSILKKKICLR